MTKWTASSLNKYLTLQIALANSAVITIWVGGDVRDLERVIGKVFYLATQYPKTIERLVLYNPIGLTTAASTGR